jgi:hypothetical protein
VDYYTIDIAQGITSIPAQTIVDRCYAGQVEYCAAIARGVGAGGGNVITEIRLQPFNAAFQSARGLDFEASYHVGLAELQPDWKGSLDVRFLATHYLKNYTNDGVNPPYDTVGNNSATGNNSASGPPHWVYHGTVTYTADPVTVAVTARGLSSGIYYSSNYPYTACTSGCPAATSTTSTINSAAIPGAFYMDATFIYKLRRKADAGYDLSAFLNVANIANKDPVTVASGPGGLPYAQPATNPTLYDVLGRVFRAGIRLQM